MGVYLRWQDPKVLIVVETVVHHVAKVLISATIHSGCLTHSVAKSLHNDHPLSFFMYMAQIFSDYSADIILIGRRSIHLVLPSHVLLEGVFRIILMPVLKQREQCLAVLPMYLEVPPGRSHHDVLDLIADRILCLLLISLWGLDLEDFEQPVDHVDDGCQFDAPVHIFVQIRILIEIVAIAALKVFEVPQVRNAHSGFQSRAIERIRINILLELDYGVDRECAELY
jgi:hypothetical protein